MSAPKEIERLVERFADNAEAYKAGNYNETQVRHEFIDPFFELLGWDINNTQGHAEAYKDVIHEDAIKVGAATKAPDYCFRIGGTRKFFIEAKKPAVNVKDDVNPAFQLRRYAWSSKLPLSILTDFEEFSVYDCRVKPVKTDKASAARVKYYHYHEYPQRWEEIASIFSREAILKGSFDKFAEKSRLKKGTAEVDTAFLDEIESWRDSMARNIALRNGSLTIRQLNFAVQKTIDRIIFLRICEDRGIEPYGQLLGLTNGTGVYGRLCTLFRKADDLYNSGLFHFQPEKERPEEPDDLTPGLAIDDKPLKDILKTLYYPDCPYEFSVLPAEILGQVYEQFLGKVITLTKGHQAKIEEKPEVKKAGGVYYTPKYIVDYIVENTVGRLVEGKSPKEAEKLRILDPACGSGSFLIGAYQYLLDWHLKWYLEHEPEKHRKGKEPRIADTPSGGLKLTTAEKKRILLNNIYGVDIDSQAVEVTKLSLLLKVLEGERQLVLFHKERALPDLGANIKCGNSLIGPDFYEGKQMTMFDEEEHFKINAFDWRAEFEEVFRGKRKATEGTEKEEGFDAVIGNPPYIPLELMTYFERDYYRQKNPFLERKYDSAVIFIAQMIQKLNSNGLLSFISSVTWQTGQNYSKLRKYLFENSGLQYLVNLPFNVFKNAYVDTGVYVFSKKEVTAYKIYQFPKKSKSFDMLSIPYKVVKSSFLASPDYKIILEPIAANILNRFLLMNEYVKLGDISISTQGLSASRFQTSGSKNNEMWFPFLEKGQTYRYRLQTDKIVFADMSEKKSLIPFYKASPKILIRRVISRQDRLLCTYFEKEMVFKKDINPFIITNIEYDPFYVLGILNSTLFSFVYINTSSIATKDDFRQTTLAELRDMPLPKTNKNVNQFIQMVETMLGLQKSLAVARTPEEKKVYERQIMAVDGQIDRAVYELYGLGEEEIKMVEGG